MSKYEAGDMVVLISGSMRMAVESVEEETVNVVWCHEGRIGRDSFDEKLLNKWETREYVERAPREDRGHRDDRGPRGKTGWDGRPREKKFYRADD